MENTKRKVTISLNSVEIDLIDAVEKKCGYNAQEILRIGLRLYYAQEMKPVRSPGRPKKEKTEEMQTEYKMPPEIHCINVLNGEVVEIEGVKCCKYQVGVCEITDPLSTLKY